MAKDDYVPLLIGAGALLILAKWGIDALGNIRVPNPVPAITGAITETGEELTGGIRKSSDETLDEWAFEFDVPFSDKRLPLTPGLVRDRGAVYTTETTGAVSMDIAEPRESWGEWAFEFDLPGLEPYDLRDAPADLYNSTLGKVLR